MEKDNERTKCNLPREEKVGCFRGYDYHFGHRVLRAARLEERRRNAVCSCRMQLWSFLTAVMSLRYRKSAIKERTKVYCRLLSTDMSRFGRDHILVGYYTKYYLAEADVRFI